LHIAEDSLEFLEDSKKGLLNKYNKFMPIPIKFGTKTEKLNKKKAKKLLKKKRLQK
jgi:molecular chaperone HtpG